ncbi:PIN domain-like protein, partial [Dimargaris cristalligena]
MGVQGLWPLLEPAARPTKLESLRGRRLAIDASIWLHQFIKAIKDKEGNALPNSHILGFLRRICKLLYYGIKPVFVFDGQTPEIKRKTIVTFLTSLEHNSPAQVRQHLHSEITQFRQRQTREERYASEVNAEMVSDIQLLLRLFGIPFTTAPTEAEAECAQLSQQGLIDGIVTDDSDVFLFGGTQVFRHMFNQAKSVEYYLLADLGQEMAIDRTILIQLAYLLGSDYTDGIPGVGLVNALEILNEFRGPAALADFKTWWL